MRKIALDYLDDPVFYADLIDCLKGGAEIVAAGAAGVLLRTADDTCLAAADNPDCARRLLDQLDHCRQLVAHDEHSLAAGVARFGLTPGMTCYSSAYLGTGLPPVQRDDLHIDTLTPDWVDTVAEHYHADDRSYLTRLLRAGVMLGAFRGDTLVGFIGQHATGAMGLLEVFPEYRRQGIARYLLTHLTNKLLAAGHVPYDHIVVGNDASEALQRGLGFTISTRTLTWMWGD